MSHKLESVYFEIEKISKITLTSIGSLTHFYTKLLQFMNTSGDNLIDEKFSLLLGCCMKYVECIEKYIIRKSGSRGLVQKCLVPALSKIDILSHFLKRIIALADGNTMRHYFNAAVKIVLEKVIDSKTDHLIAKEIVNGFNCAVRGKSNYLQTSFAQDNQIFLTGLVDLLCTCGNFNLQFSVLETIFHLCFPTQIKEVAPILFPEFNYQFSTIKYSTFDSDARDFINAINTKHKDVLSIKCESLVLGNTNVASDKVLPFWVDFNIKVRNITLVCCFPSSGLVEEAENIYLLIDMDDIATIEITGSEQSLDHQLFYICINIKSYAPYSSSTVANVKRVTLGVQNCLEVTELENILLKIFERRFLDYRKASLTTSQAHEEKVPQTKRVSRAHTVSGAYSSTSDAMSLKARLKDFNAYPICKITEKRVSKPPKISNVDELCAVYHCNDSSSTSDSCSSLTTEPLSRRLEDFHEYASFNGNSVSVTNLEDTIFNNTPGHFDLPCSISNDENSWKAGLSDGIEPENYFLDFAGVDPITSTPKKSRSEEPQEYSDKSELRTRQSSLHLSDVLSSSLTSSYDESDNENERNLKNKNYFELSNCTKEIQNDFNSSIKPKENKIVDISILPVGENIKKPNKVSVSKRCLTRHENLVDKLSQSLLKPTHNNDVIVLEENFEPVNLKGNSIYGHFTYKHCKSNDNLCKDNNCLQAKKNKPVRVSVARRRLTQPNLTEENSHDYTYNKNEIVSKNYIPFNLNSHESNCFQQGTPKTCANTETNKKRTLFAYPYDNDLQPNTTQAVKTSVVKCERIYQNLTEEYSQSLLDPTYSSCKNIDVENFTRQSDSNGLQVNTLKPVRTSVPRLRLTNRNLFEGESKGLLIQSYSHCNNTRVENIATTQPCIVLSEDNNCLQANPMKPVGVSVSRCSLTQKNLTENSSQSHSYSHCKTADAESVKTINLSHGKDHQANINKWELTHSEYTTPDTTAVTESCTILSQDNNDVQKRSKKKMAKNNNKENQSTEMFLSSDNGRQSKSSPGQNDLGHTKPCISEIRKENDVLEDNKKTKITNFFDNTITESDLCLHNSGVTEQLSIHSEKESQIVGETNEHNRDNGNKSSSGESATHENFACDNNVLTKCQVVVVLKRMEDVSSKIKQYKEVNTIFEKKMPNLNSIQNSPIVIEDEKLKRRCMVNITRLSDVVIKERLGSTTAKILSQNSTIQNERDVLNITAKDNTLDNNNSKTQLCTLDLNIKTNERIDPTTFPLETNAIVGLKSKEKSDMQGNNAIIQSKMLNLEPENENFHNIVPMTTSFNVDIEHSEHNAAACSQTRKLYNPNDLSYLEEEFHENFFKTADAECSPLGTSKKSARARKLHSNAPKRFKRHKKISPLLNIRSMDSDTNSFFPVQQNWQHFSQGSELHWHNNNTIGKTSSVDINEKKYCRFLTDGNVWRTSPKNELIRSMTYVESRKRKQKSNYSFMKQSKHRKLNVTFPRDKTDDSKLKDQKPFNRTKSVTPNKSTTLLDPLSPSLLIDDQPDKSEAVHQKQAKNINILSHVVKKPDGDIQQERLSSIQQPKSFGDTNQMCKMNSTCCGSVPKLMLGQVKESLHHIMLLIEQNNKLNNRNSCDTYNFAEKLYQCFAE